MASLRGCVKCHHAAAIALRSPTSADHESAHHSWRRCAEGAAEALVDTAACVACECEWFGLTGDADFWRRRLPPRGSEALSWIGAERFWSRAVEAELEDEDEVEDDVDAA